MPDALEAILASEMQKLIDLFNHYRYLIVAVVVFAAHSSSISNGFVWDDAFSLVNNEKLRDITNIPGFFFSEQAELDMHVYRPMRKAVFSFIYQLNGLSPALFHTANLFAHIAMCILSMLLFEQVLANRTASVALSILYGVHPLTTESVANVTGMTDMLYGSFFIAAALFLFRSIASRKALDVALMGMCFACALFSKEPAIAFVPVVLVLIYQRGGMRIFRDRFLLVTAGVPVVISAGYLILRSFVVGDMVVTEYYDDSFAVTMFTQAKIMLLYLKLFFLPVTLSARYDIDLVKSITNPYLIFSLLIFIPLTIKASYDLALRRSSIFATGILWFLITLLPVSNIVPIPASMMGERFLYVPMIGLFIASYPVISRLNIPKRLLVFLFIIITIILSYLTFERDKIWKDHLTLFEDTVKKSPDSLVVNMALYREYIKNGNDAAALHAYKELLRINQKNAAAHLNTARRHLANKNTKRAIFFAEKALTTKPDYEEARLFMEKLKAENQ